MTTRKANTNLRAVPGEADKLTWCEIDRLAAEFADDLMTASVDAAPLIILVSEISKHPFDNSHVETVANVLEKHLLDNTKEAEEFRRRLVRELREKIGKGGEG